MKPPQKSWKGGQIDLALAVSALSLLPGERRTIRQLSDFSTYDPVRKRWVKPVSSQRFSQIEHRALRKLRVAMYRDKELCAQLGLFYKR